MEEHANKCASKIGNLLPTGNTVYGECDCDGYHTFTELYDHRITLYIALCKHMHDLYALENPRKYKIWKSKTHSDGGKWEGWFILGIGTEKGSQITYHLPIKHWDEIDPVVEELEKAPEWDGHTSDDVLERLKKL